MTDPAIPSKDPASDTDLASVLKSVLDKYMKSVDGMLPATVVSYNRATGRATVAPSVLMVQTNGQTITRAPLANIPVLALGGGGWSITFPLKPGDTGWIEASDRDISIWLQGSGKRRSQPNTHRIHSFSDGRFIPDAMANFSPAADIDGAMCIQNKTGNVALILSESGVKILGKVDMPDGAKIGGIEFGTHVHGGVETGTGTSGAPVA